MNIIALGHPFHTTISLNELKRRFVPFKSLPLRNVLNYLCCNYVQNVTHPMHFVTDVIYFKLLISSFCERRGLANQQLTLDYFVWYLDKISRSNFNVIDVFTIYRLLMPENGFSQNSVELFLLRFTRKHLELVRLPRMRPIWFKKLFT